MKFAGYTLNTPFLKTVGAVIVLMILACTVWPWFLVPLLILLASGVLTLLIFWGYQKWGSP